MKAPSLLDPGVSRTSVPPLYTHLQLWSCSVALRPPPTLPSLMRVRAGGERTLRQNRQQRHPCAPRVCPGRRHSVSTPTQPFGHAPFPPEPEIAIFAPAAAKLKVVRSPSKSRPAIPVGNPSFVARSGRLHVSRPASLTMPNVLVMLDFAVLTFSLF